MASLVARRSLHVMQVLRLASHLLICPPPSRLPERRPHASATHRLLAPSPSPALRRGLSVVRGRRGGMDPTSEEQVMDNKKRKQEQVDVDSEKIEQEEKPGVGVQEPVDSKIIDQEGKHDVEEQVAIDSKEIEQKEEDDSEAEAESEEGILRVESPVGERFRLNGSCSLVLQRGDITKWFKDGQSDAIVNAANERMLGGGGVDGAIHRAAGRGLLEACFRVPEVSRGVRCPVGSAVITPGFNLPVSQVIHTVGPMYYSEGDPASVLAKAYKSSVNLAVKNGVKYIAFPAISCGIYGYPYDEAAEVSIQALQDSAGQLSEVHFVLFEAETYGAWLAEAEEKLERLPKSQV